MKYAVELGSYAMMYIPALIKIGADVQKLIGMESQAHRQCGDLISLRLFFQNKESRLIFRNGHLGNRGDNIP
jgi:hypothetical protein